MTRTLPERGLTNQQTSVVGRRVRQGWWSSLPVTVGAVSADASVQASATTHTLGAWTEVIASTSEDVDCVVVLVSNVAESAFDTATMVSIATGAAGAETAFISDIAVGSAAGINIYSGSTLGIAFAVPMVVPKGTRISAAVQSRITNKVAKVAVQLAKSPTMVQARAARSFVTFGTSTATSSGTAMSASAGTWTQITASTPRPLSGIMVVPSATSSSVVTSSNIVMTVGVGAAGAEAELGSITCGTPSTNEQMSSLGYGLIPTIPCDLPAGVRLAVKASIGSNTIDVTLIGIPRIA